MKSNIIAYITENNINIDFNNTNVVFDIKDKSLDSVGQNINLFFSNSNIVLSEKYSFDVDNFKIEKNSEGLILEGEILDPNLPIQKNGELLNKLNIKGSYTNEILDIKTKDNTLSLKIDDLGQISLDINNLDLLYNTDDTNNNLDDKHINVNGINSSIFINDKHKLMSNKYSVSFIKNKMKFKSMYKDSLIEINQDINGFKLIKASNLNSKLVNTLLGTKLVEGGVISLSGSGIKDKIEGKITFKDNKIKNLAFLNNLILFLNTSPILINPLFVLPTAIDIAKNKGVSVGGYSIKEGNIDFIYYINKEIFDAKKIYTKGSIVDFDGFATINLQNSTINSDINVAFLKSYTNLVKNIPIVGYIFLGKDEKVTTKVNIKGDLDNPEYTTHLVKDGASLPIDLIKRVIKLPKKLLNSIGK